MNQQPELKSNNSDIGMLGLFSVALMAIVLSLFVSGHVVFASVALIFSSGVFITFLGACGLLDWIPPTIDFVKKIAQK